MRVAFVVGEFPLLSESFVLNQITGLIDRGHQVDIYAERRGGRGHPDVDRYGLLSRARFENMPASRVWRALALPGRLAAAAPAPAAVAGALSPRRHGLQALSLRLLYQALPFVRAGRYDAVHAHFGANGCRAAAMLELGLLSGPLITSFHGADIMAYPRQRGRDVYAPLFARGAWFLPVSDRWNAELVRLGCPADRIRVHRMGVDCERFRPAADIEAPRGELRVISVARLVPKKGLEYALDALALVGVRGRDATLAIAGAGPERGRLEDRARGLGLSDRVTWLGPVSHDRLPEVLAGADVFLAPSVTPPDGDIEGVPVAIIEAMASGLPVVATSHGAIPDLVSDQVTGLLAAERDAPGLAERIERLAADPTLRKRLGAAGRACVEREFEIGRLNDALVELYRTFPPACASRAPALY